MDLRLFWGVAKRYKRLSIGGTLLAIVLAVLAYGTPSFSGGMPTVVARASSTYQSAAELLLTPGSGTYGNAGPKTVAVGAPGYMSSLSPVYTGLANGTAVQDAVRAAKVPGTVKATEGVDPLTGAYTPFVNLIATGPTASDAEILVKRGIAAFQHFVTQTEAASGVPGNARVQLEVVKTGLPATLAAGPKPTIPILVLLAVFAGTVALMFSMENRDPQTAVKLGRVVPRAVATVSAEPGSRSTGEHTQVSHRNGAERRTTIDNLIKAD